LFLLDKTVQDKGRRGAGEQLNSSLHLNALNLCLAETALLLIGNKVAAVAGWVMLLVGWMVEDGLMFEGGWMVEEDWMVEDGLIV
jgi:hypothetical protein